MPMAWVSFRLSPSQGFESHIKKDGAYFLMFEQLDKLEFTRLLLLSLAGSS